jgi:hypothetical protein
MGTTLTVELEFRFRFIIRNLGSYGLLPSEPVVPMAHLAYSYYPPVPTRTALWAGWRWRWRWRGKASSSLSGMEVDAMAVPFPPPATYGA